MGSDEAAGLTTKPRGVIPLSVQGVATTAGLRHDPQPQQRAGDGALRNAEGSTVRRATATQGIATTALRHLAADYSPRTARTGACGRILRPSKEEVPCRQTHDDLQKTRYLFRIQPRYVDAGNYIGAHRNIKLRGRVHCVYWWSTCTPDRAAGPASCAAQPRAGAIYMGGPDPDRASLCQSHVGPRSGVDPPLLHLHGELSA
jgi:hypothetical protein